MNTENGNMELTSKALLQLLVCLLVTHWEMYVPTMGHFCHAAVFDFCSLENKKHTCLP